MPRPEDHDDLHDLVELVNSQAAALAAQAARIDELERRLAASDAPATASPIAPTGDPAAPADPARPDRRSLLRHAGLATAGALGGAAVLAQASPAMAAQGAFDGNPAVIGTANPTTGLGVRGETLTGTGVQGRSQAAVGPATGVEGLVAGTASTAVKGTATATTSATIGVSGTVSSVDGIAVKATNTSTAIGDAIAVFGNTNGQGGIGVFGRAGGSGGPTVGVRGSSVNSTLGTGVAADGVRTGLRADADAATGSAVEIGLNRTALRFTNPNPPPLTNPSPKTYAVGDIVYDTAGDLWICTTAGTPGSFRRLGGTTTAGSLVVLSTPVRVNDSRPGEVPLNSTKGPITGNTTRVIDMKNNSSGVPVGATAVLCTLTVVNTSANGGFLSLFRNGAATPATSTINWTAANQVVGTTTVTAVDATAQAKVFCPPNSSTNFFVDVIGFYQ